MMEAGLRLAGVGLVAFSLARPALATEATACPVPEEAALVDIDLPASRKVVRERQRLVVLTLGGASTLGKAAHGAEHSYPARLQARLRARLPDVDVTVETRAAARRSVRGVLQDLDADLTSTGARLVIWGAGGIEAGLGSDPVALAEDLGIGIEHVRAAGADVILVDPQFAPSVSRIVDLAPYRDAVRRTGAADDVPVLDRYELMRSWSTSGLLDLDAVEPDLRVQVARRLFDCLAEVLSDAIVPALTRNDGP
jgi:hypothetical protein